MLRAPAEYRLPFVGRHKETPTSTTFRFSTGGSGFEYRSNQAIRIVFPGLVDSRPWRMFSLSSSPTEGDHVAVTVKMTGSPFKDALLNLRAGDPVHVIGPLGDLLYDPTRPAVFLAGGIGVTPFRGMIRYAADTGAEQPIVLLYSSRVPEEFAFRKELDALVKRHPTVQVRYTVTRPQESATPWNGRRGRIDEAWVREALEGLSRPKVYVVGLPEMASETIGMLKERLGFDEDDLEYEYFLGY